MIQYLNNLTSMADAFAQHAFTMHVTFSKIHTVYLNHFHDYCKQTNKESINL